MDDHEIFGLIVAFLCLILFGWLATVVLPVMLHHWLIVLGLLAAWWAWQWLLGPWLRWLLDGVREGWREESARQAREAQERLRHQLARREIERIYQTTVVAMSEIAACAQLVNPHAGTAVERRPAACRKEPHDE